MKRWLPLILVAVLVVALPIAVARADELTDTTNALLQKQTDLQKAQAALQQAKAQVASLSGNLPSLQSSLNIAIAEVNVKQAELDAAVAKLDQQTAELHQQQTDRQERVLSLYKQYKKESVSPMLALLDSNDINVFTKLISYHQMSLQDDKTRIASLDEQVTKLSQQKAALQTQSNDLKSQKDQLQARVDSLRRQIANAQKYSASANAQIASINKDIKGLSAKQEQILAQKAAANAISTTIGSTPPPTTVLPNPPFGGPAYAFASYGAPHRVGMNQYGAYGRALAGQNYQQILTTYYSNTSIVTVAVPDTINVSGYGNIAFEANYLKGISEMPRGWPLEALKAQAIAARTYAMKYIQDNGGAICTTEACQVYNGGRINGTGADDLRWYQAVAETQGQVLKSNGQLISAWYSSTNGGYTQSSAQVWGGATSWTHVVKDYAGSWPSGAYDKASPWFHKAWGESNGTPWLTKQQMVQIFNAAIKYQQTNNASSIEADLSTFTSPLTDFADVAFSHDDNAGQTTGIIVIGTNQGTVTISGAAVRAAVNLKTPGSIQLKSTLYDVIKF